jgi:hypothetical protein
MKTNQIITIAFSCLLLLPALFSCKKDSADPVNSGLPVITTVPVTDIKMTTCTTGVKVVSRGASGIFESGICWSTSPAPDVNLPTKKNLHGGDEGTVWGELTGLTGGTTYFVRAYAINSNGVGYGNELSFTTKNPCDFSSIDKGFLEYEFSKDSILGPGTYKMNRNFTVKANQKLTLMPGVVIEAQGNFEFKIEGIVKSLGTASCPVIFSSKTKTAGDWYGVYVNSNDTANIFDYTIFEYGGYGNSALNKVCAKFSPGNTGGLSRASFRNCTFRFSSGYGFVSDGEGNTLETMEGSIFSDNASAPISLAWEQAEFLKSNCTYSGNGKNSIQLSCRTQNLTKNCHLLKQPIAYQTHSTDGFIQVKPYTLKVNPGVTLVLNPANHFIFLENARADFQGTAAEPITIKGANNTAGSWGGFLFVKNPSDNIFRFVNFSDGGNPTTNGIQKGMINLSSGDVANRVTIENCTFSNSPNYGLGVYDYPSDSPPPSVAARNIVNGATRSGISAAFSAANNTAGTNMSPSLFVLYP